MITRLTQLSALLLGLAACGSPGRDLVVRVEPAPVMPASYPVGAEVGRLLSADPAISKAAEARLIALDGEAKAGLLTYVATLGAERDLRLLHVLDEHHALPELPIEAHLDFLLWKAARPERFYVMKAQSRLIDLARADPAPLIARLERGAPGSDVLAVVLAVSGTRQAVPALVDRYRHAVHGTERAAAAEALGMLAGATRRPRATGSAAQIARNADALDAWYREQLDLEAEAAAATGPAEGSAP